FAPQLGTHKVYIIDEVHMLSTAAFNAFLKTLEEPPKHAIFILATTEKHKILPTILSRCQIYDFKRISVADIVGHLKNIANQENIQAEDNALHIVAEKADGALRDALSIFDRLVSFSGNKLTYEDAVKNLNVLDHDYFFKITEQLLSADLPSAILELDNIISNGFEGDQFMSGLSNHFRNLMVCKDERTIKLLEVSNDLKQKYFVQSKITPLEFLVNALSLASDCDVNYAQSIHKRLLVETTLMKMAYLSNAVKIEEANYTNNSEKKSLNQK
ncbi:MAG: DNA polymerase III subunit gamma/tau, partial [Bacteroidetes bacterium]|nr:DNA polymerase III subunit gamma/tau [Bacteroidota bacterium]